MYRRIGACIEVWLYLQHYPLLLLRKQQWKPQLTWSWSTRQSKPKLKSQVIMWPHLHWSLIEWNNCHQIRRTVIDHLDCFSYASFCWSSPYLSPWTCMRLSLQSKAHVCRHTRHTSNCKHSLRYCSFWEDCNYSKGVSIKGNLVKKMLGTTPSNNVVSHTASVWNKSLRYLTSSLLSFTKKAFAFSSRYFVLLVPVRYKDQQMAKSRGRCQNSIFREICFLLLDDWKRFFKKDVQ